MLKNIFKGTFYKYLISYILCFFLPAGIFSLLYTTVFLSSYTEQSIGKTSQSIDDTFKNIDLRMYNVREIYSGILSSDLFSNRTLIEYPRLQSYYKISAFLRNYTTLNEFINDIWIYDRENQWFFSSVNMLSYGSFIRFGSSYPDMVNTLVDIFNSTGGDIWIPETKVQIFRTSFSLMTYIIVYPYSATHNNIAVAVFMEKDIFERALRAVIPYGKSTAAIIDRQGQIIYNLNPTLNNTLEKILARHEFIDGTKVINIDEGKFFIYGMNSAQNQLHYISLIPYSELTIEVRNHTLAFAISLLGLLLGGSFLIYLLMEYNYKPLKNVFSLYKSLIGIRKTDDDKNTVTNEIELIRITLENIHEENKTLSILNKKFLREEILFNLLKGNIINTDALHSIGIGHGSKIYTVVIFQFDKIKSINFKEFDFIINKVLSTLIKVFLIEYLEKNSFIGILEWQDETLKMQETLEILCTKIIEEKKSEIRAAFGSQVKQIDDISRSYLEAKTALRYQIRNMEQKVVEFQNINKNTIPENIYLHAEMNTLEESVKTKNSRRTAFIISELIDTIKNKNTSYFYAVCLCYNIINIFFLEIRRIRSNIAMEIFKKHQMLFLENFDHPIENLIVIVQSLSMETMRILDVEQTNPRIFNKENILKFIDKNFRNSDFCIQTIMDHFNISNSNLSHQFKIFIGENLSSYINTLKMNYARELLCSSNLTVNEIALKLGYFQTSSFIKRFKSTEGISPGEYRNKNNVI